MKKVLLKIVFVFVVLLVLSSCKTPDPQVEYVPVELDVETLIQPILDMRPETVNLIDDPRTLSDLMSNSVSFQFAYERWMDYALTLEGFYLDLENKTQT